MCHLPLYLLSYRVQLQSGTMLKLLALGWWVFLRDKKISLIVLSFTLKQNKQKINRQNNNRCVALELQQPSIDSGANRPQFTPQFVMLCYVNLESITPPSGVSFAFLPSLPLSRCGINLA